MKTLSNRWIIGVVSGVILAFIGMGLWGLFSVNQLFKNSSAAPTQGGFVKWVGVKVPAEATQFRAYAEGWQDWIVEARFELPNTRVAGFLAENGLVRTEPSNGLESSLKQAWFSSSATLERYELESLPEKAASLPSGFYPTVWLDASKPSITTVFIRAFDT